MGERGLGALCVFASLVFSGEGVAQTESDNPYGSSSLEETPEAPAPTDAVTEESAKGGEPASSEATPHPWQTNATQEQKALARRLFNEGNALVRESLFHQGVQKYEAALGHWDHPGIHYNLALALISLDQPVRLRTHLKAAIVGADGLGEDKARRARHYLTLVEKQLTPVKIVSKHAGAAVELDGKLLFTAPGEYVDYLDPGRHTLKASSEGFETAERPLTLTAGERTVIELKLYRPDEWIQYERRWDPWGPVAVTAGGVAVLAAGAVAFGWGVAEIESFDRQVRACGARGCAPGRIDASASDAEAAQGVGISLMVVGGLATAAGGVLLYLNREIPRRVDPEANQVGVLPVVGPDVFGLSARGRF